MADPTIQHIIHQSFLPPVPILTAIHPLPDIFFNSLYLLTLSPPHPPLILKISPDLGVRVLRSDVSLNSREASILSLISERAPSVPVPTIRAHDASNTILPSPYLLLSHISGRPVPPSTPLSRAAGAHLRSIASITNTTFGRTAASATQYSTWREAFTVLFEAIMRDGEDRLVQLPYGAIRSALQRHGAALDQVLGPRLTVVDFDGGSVLMEEGDVTGIIDVERAIWGDPMLARCFRDEDVVGEGFWEGFGGVRGEGKARVLYEAYHCVVIVVGRYYYGLREDEEMLERRRLIGCLDRLRGD